MQRIEIEIYLNTFSKGKRKSLKYYIFNNETYIFEQECSLASFNVSVLYYSDAFAIGLILGIFRDCHGLTLLSSCKFSLGLDCQSVSQQASLLSIHPSLPCSSMCHTIFLFVDWLLFAYSHDICLHFFFMTRMAKIVATKFCQEEIEKNCVCINK